jgi:AraC family transcriptional regulator
MPYICTLRRLQHQPAMAVRCEVPPADVAAATIAGFRTVDEFLRRSGATPAGGTYARYLRIGRESLHLEVGFTVRELLPAGGPVQPLELPAGEAVVTLHRGPYERLPEAVAALEDWMREHGRVAAGPHWEVYLNGPPDVTAPELFETEVFVPLKE